MSNPAFMTVVFEGDKRELKSLYNKMKRLELREKPLIDNSFYTPNRWLGCLVKRLRGSWRKVYCHGTWSDLVLKEDHLYFFTETAWRAPFEVLELIKECYPTMKYYFTAEGDDWDWYYTNDAEGKYFTSRYVVDMEPDIEYFDSIEEACKHVSKYVGKAIAPSWDALYDAAEAWNEANPDADWPINLKEIKVVTIEEII